MSSGEDVLTIQGHSSQAGDLLNIGTYVINATSDAGEIFNVNSSGETRIGKIQSVEISSASTTYTVLSSNSGKRHIVPGVAKGKLITMPAHDAGLNYSFYVKLACSSNGLKWQLPSTPGTIVHGAVIDAATIVGASIADIVGGTKLDLWSDGTNWFMGYADAASTTLALLTVAAT